MKRVDIDIPTENRQVLVHPPVGELPDLVKANRALIATHDFHIAGRSAADLRTQVRAEVMSAARTYTRSLGVSAPEWDAQPIIETGHQPEFLHPGVWIKNHLAGRLAHAVGAVALNLVVDNDVPREGEFLVPTRPGSGFSRHPIHFADIDSSRAWEEHTHDCGPWRFDALAQEIAEIHALSETGAIYPDYLSDAARFSGMADDLAHMMTLMRRTYEEQTGLHNLEIPISTLSDTPGFVLFVLDVVSRAERFAECYNDALAEFRSLHGVRSSSHPLPNLHMEPDSIELPFWVWRPGGPRTRLYVRCRHDATLLMGDEPVFTIDDVTWQALQSGDAEAFDAAARHLLKAADGSFKIRPRAISNTIFSRLFVSDAFVHGVGGARYDTITDEIVRNYVGVELPALIACSATIFLPIDVEASRQDDLRRLRRTLRDCRYNPERHMDEVLLASKEVGNLIAGKRSLVAENDALRPKPSKDSRVRRRSIFQEIRRADEEMNTLMPDTVALLRRELAEVEHRVGDTEIVEDRTYPFILYPKDQLLGFYDEMLKI